MSKKVENTDIQIDNVTNGVSTKPVEQVQFQAFEYDNKQYIFDMSKIIEPIIDEKPRSLRDYNKNTPEEYVEIPINVLKGMQQALDFYISSLFQPPERHVVLKSTSIKELTCYVYYKKNEWKAQLKYQDRCIPHPLPIVSSKKEIYEANTDIVKRLSEHLLDNEFTRDIVKDKNCARRIVHEIQSDACNKMDEIDSLKIDLPTIEEIEEPKTEEEKAVEKRKKLITKYGEVVYNKSVELITNGQAQNFIIKKHCSVCAGEDKKISYTLSCVFASTHLLSSDTGEHLKLSGESGKGKTHYIRSYTELLPSTFYKWTLPTGKNLFYNEELHEGMVIVIDEWENADIDLIRAIKLCTSQFQKATTLDTVINFEAVPKIVPPRISFILMSVSQLDSEELTQRFVTVDMPKDSQYLEEINKKQKEKACLPASKEDKPDFDTEVCRCIYSILFLNTYDIIIPFSKVIKWEDINHTRNWELFIDLIRCSAFYNILNRDHIINPYNNEVSYLANYEDYENAIKIYNELSKNNSTKLSNNELKTINVLVEARKQDIEAMRTSGKTVKDLGIVPTGVDEITTFGEMNIVGGEEVSKDEKPIIGGMYIKDLSKAVGVSEVTIRNIIHGPKNDGGLLKKVIGLYSMKVGDKVGEQIHHKEKVWYNGLDFIVSKVPIVSRDIIEKETHISLEKIYKIWNKEVTKWSLDEAANSTQATSSLTNQ